MNSPLGKVVVLELNEITWDLLDPLMRRGLLPNFEALVRGGVRADAWASEKTEHLDPWVTWTTLYTGTPQEVHRLSMLEQDRESLGAKRIWEYLQEAGLRVGLFGSANSWPPMPVEGFWIPGSFSRNFAAFPQSLEPIQALNVGLTRGHTTCEEKMPSMKTLLPQLMRLGLSGTTILQLAYEMGRIRLNPETAWKKISFQPVLNIDLFTSLYRKYRPHFATFHSNHVAYYQHRFWRAMDPEAFEVPPSEEERSVYGDAIEYGYKVADRILGKLRQRVGPEVNIVVLSSCGQQPATGGRYSEDHKQDNVGLQIRIEALLESMGVTDQVRYSTLMAPQWKVDCDDPELLERIVKDLGQARNLTQNAPVFAVHVEGRSICLGAHRNQKMDDTLQFKVKGQDRRFQAGDLLQKHSEVVKSGKHHPKGILLMSGPAMRSNVTLKACDNLDIAPTLLHLLGQPIPSVMNGRVLEEALLGPTQKQAFVA